MKVGFPALVLGFIVLGVLAGVAFGGGVLYGRNSAPTPKAGAAPAPAANAQALASPGAGGGAGGRGGAGGGGGAAALGNLIGGAIDSINNNTVVIRTQAGVLTTVQLSPTTKVENTVVGSSTDLKPGAVVCVQGSPNDSGVISATTVDIAPTCLTLGIINAGAAAGAGGAGGRGAGGTPAAGGADGADGRRATPAAGR